VSSVFPQVTVVMPVFNAERYVCEAVESILSQTFGDFECLVFDDGSSDRSFELISQYPRRDSRVTVFQGDHEGYARWLNRGIELARGNFIARMDADDISLPDRFMRQVRFLSENPSVVAVGCDAYCIDQDGDMIGVARHETDSLELQKSLLEGKLGVIAHPTAMIRRDALVRAGRYRPEYEPTEDLDLWLRLLGEGQLANIPDLLFKYRYHSSSVSHTRAERQQQLTRLLLDEHRRQHQLPPLPHNATSFEAPSVAAEHRRWARSSLALGHRSTARKHLRYAMQTERLSIQGWILLGASRLPAMIPIGAKRLLWFVKWFREKLTMNQPRK
jgi:cellulose synthase/poly-beta-1,6-N-acetylglucosamine synthase-like glycosyltransferase